jgi:hypothetical protein
LHSRSFCQSAYWDAPWWHHVLRRIKNSETQLGWVLWQPFISEAWKQNFLAQIAAQPAGTRPCA